MKQPEGARVFICSCVPACVPGPMRPKLALWRYALLPAVRAWQSSMQAEEDFFARRLCGGDGRV